jgi:hypothetical protein
MRACAVGEIRSATSAIQQSTSDGAPRDGAWETLRIVAHAALALEVSALLLSLGLAQLG